MVDEQMNDYPPITGKLREKLAEYKPTENGYMLTTQSVGQTGYARLVELCDTIDAIHTRLEAAYDRLRAERDSMAAALDRAEGEHDYAPDSHYMMLPKDADGEPIHVGDTVTCGRSVWQVTGLRLTGAAWGICCTIFNNHGGSGTNVYPPCDLRHYHAPTVEDVLREFGIDWEYEQHSEDRAALLAEYAAKLRLAGDAE